MSIRRLVHVLIAFTILAGIEGGRLFWLQVVRPALPPGSMRSNMTAASVQQRAQELTVDSGRGMIVDRHGAVLAGHEAEGLLLLPGGADEANDLELETLARILGTDRRQLLEAWRSVRKPAWWTPDGIADRPAPLTKDQAAALRALAVRGTAVTNWKMRYSERPLAAHLVGFVAEQPKRMETLYGDRMRDGRLKRDSSIGAAGLELAFDRYLLGAGESRIVSYADSTGKQRMDGLGLRMAGPGNPHYPVRLVTTIDAGLQRVVEAAADRAGLAEGAVVVLDARNADILAMVSRPAFDPHRPGAAGDAWGNRALRAVPPGSVMKSFIAAAALQSGAAAPRERFLCSGEYGRYGLRCWKKGGHGLLTFEDALAQSCNIVFAEVGERMTGPQLQHFAARLGLIGTVGWRGESAIDGRLIAQLPEEDPGRLFAGDPSAADGGILAQTAIGQRDVRWTPLAAANWMVTLLHGGPAAAPRAATSLRSADGIALERYGVRSVPGSGAALSPAVSASLRRMLEKVAGEGGTAAALVSSRWPLAGKSGTAEDIVSGRPVVHQWFVGYGPADRPRYAVAVLAASRPPNSSHLATSLFGAVMDALASEEDLQHKAH